MQAFFYLKTRPAKHLVRKIVSTLVLFAFVSSLMISPAGAQVLPAPGTMVGLTAGFQPPVLLGLKIHPENPLLFDFIVDQGASQLSQEELKSETEKLVKYFLAALTIPDKQVWVNLSPYEKDRIIPDVLGQTTMGKTMLEQDYLLKQLASSLTNPDEKIGQEFWTKVKKQTKAQLGTTDVPMSTFNKVWIVPQKAEVLESQGIVLIGDKKLKVMMADDYENINAIAKNNTSISNSGSIVKNNASIASEAKQSILSKQIAASPTAPRNESKEPGNDASSISSAVFRTTILPNIEKEINEGKNFANVRQIYNSVILAAWYKKALKESLLGKVYTDKGKVAGVETDDKAMKQRIYEQYLIAFKKGVYNLIKEDADVATGDTIPRKYFSGGEALDVSNMLDRVSSSLAVKNKLAQRSNIQNVRVQMATAINERNMVAASAVHEDDQDDEKPGHFGIYTPQPAQVGDLVNDPAAGPTRRDDLPLPLPSAAPVSTKRKGPSDYKIEQPDQADAESQPFVQSRIKLLQRERILQLISEKRERVEEEAVKEFVTEETLVQALEQIWNDYVLGRRNYEENFAYEGPVYFNATLGLAPMWEPSKLEGTKDIVSISDDPKIHAAKTILDALGFRANSEKATLERHTGYIPVYYGLQMMAPVEVKVGIKGEVKTEMQMVWANYEQMAQKLEDEFGIVMPPASSAVLEKIINKKATVVLKDFDETAQEEVAAYKAMMAANKIPVIKVSEDQVAKQFVRALILNMLQHNSTNFEKLNFQNWQEISVVLHRAPERIEAPGDFINQLTVLPADGNLKTILSDRVFHKKFQDLVSQAVAEVLKFRAQMQEHKAKIFSMLESESDENFNAIAALRDFIGQGIAVPRDSMSFELLKQNGLIDENGVVSEPVDSAMQFFKIPSTAQVLKGNRKYTYTSSSAVSQIVANAKGPTAPASSAIERVGGIDFDPTNMNLQIKRDGKGVPLPLPQQNLELINIQGLFPVIINIEPVNAQNLPLFLGQNNPSPAEEKLSFIR